MKEKQFLDFVRNKIMENRDFILSLPSTTHNDFDWVEWFYIYHDCSHSRDYISIYYNKNGKRFTINYNSKIDFRIESSIDIKWETKKLFDLFDQVLSEKKKHFEDKQKEQIEKEKAEYERLKGKFWE